MNNDKKTKISNAVIRRMPRYYRHVNDLIYNGVDRISSNALGERMDLTASQIRQDLSCFGEFGQQGYGYNLEKLRSEIKHILGLDRMSTAILIGAGNLGRALIKNFDFAGCGFKLLAAFDTCNLVGTDLNGISILNTVELKQFIEQHHPDVAVLTLQRRYAIQSAKELREYGMRAFWNFTNIDLGITGDGITVENVHFADSLLTLNYMISENRSLSD